ncbi:MAG: hypothetical protein AAF829_03790 [Pseudomonadota bacterium]
MITLTTYSVFKFAIFACDGIRAALFSFASVPLGQKASIHAVVQVGMAQSGKTALMIRSKLVLSLVALVFAGTAQALSPQEIRQCNAMAATFEAKKAEIAELQEVQADLAALAESLGEAWETKEEQRLFSAGHAAQADEAQSAFFAARDEANRVAMDLNSKARMFQADASHFNAKCAAD